VSYIILFSIIALVILAVFRASKQNTPQRQRQQEPALGVLTEPALTQTVTEPLGTHEEDIPPIVEVNTLSSSATREENNAAYPLPGSFPEEEGVLTQPTDSAMPADLAIDVEEPLEKIAFIIISTIADPTRLYRGYELLQTLLTLGLRYGKRGNII
jgi:FtsZ-interacting cell division protein ZipA